MPYVKPQTTRRVTLPSDTNYYVVWKEGLKYKDLKEASKAGINVTADGDPDLDASAFSSYILLAHIDSWNLDDEQGTILPLTIDSLDMLDEEDANFLSTQLKKRIDVQETQRKK